VTTGPPILTTPSATATVSWNAAATPTVAAGATPSATTVPSTAATMPSAALVPPVDPRAGFAPTAYTTQPVGALPDTRPHRQGMYALAGALLVISVLVVVAVLVGTGRHGATPQVAAPAPPRVTPSNTYPGTPAPQYAYRSATTTPRPTTVPTTPNAPTGPAAVLLNYFGAINRHDYVAAWNLGGHNIDPGGLQHFIDGLNTTVTDTATVVNVDGDRVYITLDALQSDNTHRRFSGYYVVDGGQITSASMH
jgi:hypothetical protein